VVPDYRELTVYEIRLKRDVKARLLALTAVEKLRAKQASRLTAIQAAEANAKLFYLQANGRRRKITSALFKQMLVSLLLMMIRPQNSLSTIAGILVLHLLETFR